MNDSNRPLSREGLKLVVVCLMTLNHYAYLRLEPGSFLFTLFVDLGNATAITMCYLLVEGSLCTRSIRRYLLRLAIAAVFTQPIYLTFLRRAQDHSQIAMTQGLLPLNMFYTLLLCLCMLVVLENIPIGPRRRMVLLMIIIASAAGDWSYLAPAFTWLFYRARGAPGKERESRAFLMAAGSFFLIHFLTDVFGGEGCLSALMFALAGSAGIGIAALLVLFGYNHQSAAAQGKGPLKALARWFFYLYYPAHLLILLFL